MHLSNPTIQSFSGCHTSRCCQITPEDNFTTSSPLPSFASRHFTFRRASAKLRTQDPDSAITASTSNFPSSSANNGFAGGQLLRLSRSTNTSRCQRRLQWPSLVAIVLGSTPARIFPTQLHGLRWPPPNISRSRGDINPAMTSLLSGTHGITCHQHRDQPRSPDKIQARTPGLKNVPNQNLGMH